MANNIKYESELFQTALKYKEILIYVYKHTKIYKFNYDDKSYYFKINTKDNSLAFTKDFFDLIINKEISFNDITAEDFKLNKKKAISFLSLKNKEDYYNNSYFDYHPLLDILFSVPLNGRPRKYFKNSFGKVCISNKNEKLTGHYKKIINTNF